MSFTADDFCNKCSEIRTFVWILLILISISNRAHLKLRIKSMLDPSAKIIPLSWDIKEEFNLFESLYKIEITAWYQVLQHKSYYFWFLYLDKKKLLKDSFCVNLCSVYIETNGLTLSLLGYLKPPPPPLNPMFDV